MIWKLVKDKQGWNTLLPYVFFAYKKVPNIATEFSPFSPFEILFGRHIRGPMEVLIDLWAAGSANHMTAVQCVFNMWNLLKQMVDVAKESQEKA